MNDRLVYISDLLQLSVLNFKTFGFYLFLRDQLVYYYKVSYLYNVHNYESFSVENPKIMTLLLTGCQ